MAGLRENQQVRLTEENLDHGVVLGKCGVLLCTRRPRIAVSSATYVQGIPLSQTSGEHTATEIIAQIRPIDTEEKLLEHHFWGR